MGCHSGSHVCEGRSVHSLGGIVYDWFNSVTVAIHSLKAKVKISCETELINQRSTLCLLLSLVGLNVFLSFIANDFFGKVPFWKCFNECPVACSNSQHELCAKSVNKTVQFLNTPPSLTSNIDTRTWSLILTLCAQFCICEGEKINMQLTHFWNLHHRDEASVFTGVLNTPLVSSLHSAT